MAEDRDGLIAHYRAMRADLLAAIDGLSDEQLAEHAADGWSVNDHFAHLAHWDEMRASEVLRISAGFESGWQLTREQEATLNEMAFTLRHGWTSAQARWELATSSERLIEVIAAASARGLDATLYGEPVLRSTHEAQHTEWIRRWRAERGV